MLDKPLLINGEWRAPAGSRSAGVHNPATGDVIAQLALCERADLDAALEAAQQGFETWRRTTAIERAKILHRAAALVRERAETMAQLMSREQGKPIAEARGEANAAAEHIEWHAEEGRRAYGRVIPARVPGARQVVLREPVGPVAAFTPWNFPINQLVRKVSAALASGCSIIAKPPEEAPSACIALARAFQDAGLPPGVLGIVFGPAAEVSEHLIASPIIRKISFTGSVPVGKKLGAMAAAGVKRATMELGGHAPYIVAKDADVDAAVKLGLMLKYRNAGQVCAAPTRFYIEEDVYDAFRSGFVAGARAIKVGDGLSDGVQMGPLTHARRLDAMARFVDDAVSHGARLECGGKRVGNSGYFFEPTVLSDVPEDAAVMNDEPFGPLAALVLVSSVDEAIRRSNRLPFGLAAFGFTRSLATADRFSTELEAGMVSINHFGLAAAETPFGGLKESGYGSEGGSETLDAYLTTKFVSHIGL
ncbi:NAD-dependent succinate-semialdehyde dehydrogenase [Shinella zoogloeoides]|uniref:NAD-dependent succinate-semialdehyde dehydrogenase n=1 Tax=Shinella zoogloeoides TaxID=352475 RepID=UPI00273E8036|nr:NAD-dependent succinate-semialdehyde dehydrogenase [Shinella zoogloeoides]WLR95763.1 NAD-dependent succinate-semialdehyde dehydrogenase [Shinella zoogloeoides]